MGKAPAFQFYVKDWLSDPELQCVSASSRGLWIDALCYMWEAPERGKLIGTVDEISKLLRATNGDFTQFLDDLKRHKFATVTFGDNELTLINRRMFREQKDKENHILRQKRYKEKQKIDKEMTPPSSSSSPSPTPKKRNILSDDEWKEETKKLNPWIDWDQLNREMDTWLLNNPKRQKTRRFISNWILNKQKDKPMGKSKEW